MNMSFKHWLHMCILATLFVTAFFPIKTAFSLEADVYPDAAAEYVYRTSYIYKKKHKAFAIGPHGSFGYSWGYGSAKQAEKVALKECASDAKKFKLSGKCTLLARGNALLIANPWIGPEWQKSASGVDVPFYNGRTLLVTNQSAQGVLLYLHGCDGPGWKQYNKILGDYFNGLGFDFYAPNSFAEARPKALCGENDPKLRRQRAEITNVRIAQTQRTLSLLREKYPNKPIYIWGHSEGSDIAKRLVTKVAGIIASGDDCDVSGSPIAADTSVPVLYMFGENDPYVDGVKKPITAKGASKCRNFVRNKKTQIAVITNAAHDLFPWREDIAKALSKFIGAKSTGYPIPNATLDFRLNAKQQSALNDYKSGKTHKAIALRKDGAYSWQAAWETSIEAAYHSLYDCAAVDNVNMFSLDKQYCTLHSVNDNATQIPNGAK
jgi:dienelactone hydrolase